MNITLGFDSTGRFETLLPDGPGYDSNKIYVFVKIIDDSNGYTIYSLNSVTVFINQTNSMELITEIITQNTESSINRKLYESNSVDSLNSLIALASTLNELSIIDKKSLINTKNNSNLFLTTFGPKTNVSFDLNFKDINNIMPNFLALKIVSDFTFLSNKILIIKYYKFNDLKIN